MPYNNLTSRADVQALIPEEVSNVMLTELKNESAAMEMFRPIQIGTNQTRMPVLSALPVAYFVNGDTGLKQTTELAWANKYFNVEEIAAIVPVPEAVVDDLSIDFFEMTRPLMQQAIARTLDAAVFFGTNKPASWPDAIVTAAIAAGNTDTYPVATAAQGGLAQDIADLFALVEADGYDVTGVIAATRLRAAARSIRDADGNRTQDVTPTNWWGVDDVRYPMRGLWPAVGAGNTQAIVGQFDQGLLAIRQDITYKLLDQAVITDAANNIIFNLAQQDMIAMRVVFRCAFQVANPINYDQATEADRYPFGVLRNA